MRSRTCLIGVVIGILVLAGLCIGGYALYDQGRPAPVPMKRKIMEGVIYRREVRYFPRFMIAHILVIDTKVDAIRIMVTPRDENAGPPLKARTTSQFLEEFNLQVAVNGDGFFPWWSNSPLDYYPHVGDLVTPNGFAASKGKIYSEGPGTVPTLYISRQNSLIFNRKPSKVFNAISGDRMLVQKGKLVDGLDATELDPRTAVGINPNGRRLYLVVVDGRQPFYSEGATLQELAQVLLDTGAYYAMNLDGGGSSTMVIEGTDGQPEILNSPIDHYIPGSERAVANHLGVFIAR